MSSKILNGLSFDVEEFFHAHNLARAVPQNKWESIPSRIEYQVEHVLRTLEETNTKATFFFLAWVAERHKTIVKKVREQGHEIASHGHGHQFVYRQNRVQFKDDLKKSIAILEDITGEKVQGYRAPSFSITRSCLWALDILKEEGLNYDSSLFPVYLGNRGGVTRRFVPHEILPGLYELPVASIPILGLRLPLSGGFYFRLYPFSFTRRGIEKLNSKGEPAILYFHPWEFDSAQPKFNDIGFFLKFRHYVNLDTNMAKLKNLLTSFQWAPLKEVILRYG